VQTKALASKSPTHVAPRQVPARVPAPGRHVQAQYAHAVGVIVMPRLKVGARDDAAERQADRMAAQALAVPASREAPARAGRFARAKVAVRGVFTGNRAHTNAPAHDARTVEDTSHDGEQRAELLRELEARPLTAPDSGVVVAPPLAARVTDLRGAGAPLPPAVRADMEARFGVDFSTVRIHTGGGANTLAQQLHAHAFTIGDDIAFNSGAFAPQSAEGRQLLAHELAHVVQQRAAGAGPAAPNPQQIQRDTQEEEGVLSTLFDAAGEFLADQGWLVVRRYAPRLEPILREGPVNWLRGQLAGAFDGIVGTLSRLNPAGALDTLSRVFSGLLARAGTIIAALASGDCQPLLQAIGELKTFITDVATAAWDRLTEFLQPVGDFFTNLWNGYGAPAVQWLQDFGGELWTGLQQLGRDIWDWTQPLRDDIGAAWDWVKGELFGPEEQTEGDSSGGIVGWITRKAGEAWDWIKEQTRPVWQPVADAAQQIAELIPPPFIAHMAEQMQNLTGQLQATAGEMEASGAGRSVTENRQALASALPSVQQILATVRTVIIGAGQWLLDKLSALGEGVSGLMGRLRANALLALLANTLGWLEDAAQRAVAWARDQVVALFDWLVQGFDRLTPFFEMVLNTVRKVITVVGDLLQLPQLVLGALWNAIPECIREPIKNFVLTQILGRIPVFGQFFTDPQLWPRVQQTALEILRQVFVDGDIPRAAWTFFQAMLRVLGLPPELVVQVLAKATQAIGDVLADPIGFLGNLLRAMRAGFGRFFDNVGTHLLNGIAGWLFGAVSELGIRPPADFSLRSILGFVLEVLGITVDNVFRRLAERVGQPVVDRLRRMLDVATRVWSFVSVLVTEGPAGLWRELQERLSSLWDQVVEGVTGWVTERIIIAASRWLLSLLDATGITPIINTLIAVYNAIESFIQYLRELLEIVSRVLDGIIGIARGQVDEAAGFLENALGSSLPVAIGFLANQFGFGRISQRIREILAGVRARVDGAIDWVIDRAIRLGQSLLDMARRGVAAVRNWWQARVGFRASDGRSHEMYFRGEGRNADLIVESDPEPFRDFIARQPDGQDKTEALRLYNELRQKQDEAVRAGAASGGARGSAATAAGGSATNPSAQIDALMNQLATITARLMGGASGAAEQPAWGSPGGPGYGTDASVPTMTRAAVAAWPRGSTPSESTARLPSWQKLIRRRNDNTGASSYYVRGHLLNHNIGGPGDDWKNLTPLAQETNNRAADSMLRRFETPVKDAVDAGSTVRNFHVRPTFGTQSRGVHLTQIDAEIAVANSGSGTRIAPTLSVAQLRAIRGVIEEEQNVPPSISCSAVIEAANGSRRTLNEVIDNRPTLTQGDEWKDYRVNLA